MSITPGIGQVKLRVNKCVSDKTENTNIKPEQSPIQQLQNEELTSSFFKNSTSTNSLTSLRESAPFSLSPLSICLTPYSNLTSSKVPPSFSIPTESSSLASSRARRQQRDVIKDYPNFKWAPMIPGQEKNFSDRLNEVYRRLIKDQDETNMTEFVKSCFFNTAVLEIYNDDLKTINKMKQNNLLTTQKLKQIRDMKITNVPEPIGLYFKNESAIEEHRDMIQEIVNNQMKPIIKKEVGTTFNQLIKERMDGKTQSCEVFMSAVFKSFEILLDNIKDNFENGYMYSDNDVKNFRTRLLELYILNMQYIPSLPDLFGIPLKTNTTKTVGMSKIKIAYQNECLSKYKTKLEEAIRIYKADNNMKDDDALDENVQNDIQVRVSDKFYEELNEEKSAALKGCGKVKNFTPDPIIEEFITQNYVIKTTSSIYSSDLHDHYKEWITKNYPGQKVKPKTTFGKFVRKISLNGNQIRKFTDGKKQGWRLVRK